MHPHPSTPLALSRPVHLLVRGSVYSPRGPPVHLEIRHSIILKLYRSFTPTIIFADIIPDAAAPSVSPSIPEGHSLAHSDVYRDKRLLASPVPLPFSTMGKLTNICHARLGWASRPTMEGPPIGIGRVECVMRCT